MMSLEKIIHDQRQELRSLNDKCRLMTLQLKIIHDLDYYKSKLSEIAPKMAYKAILSNKKYIREIESVFNRPFDECLGIYEELLVLRNQIVHRYTSHSWDNRDEVYNRKITKKSLSELAKFEC